VDIRGLKGSHEASLRARRLVFLAAASFQCRSLASAEAVAPASAIGKSFWLLSSRVPWQAQLRNLDVRVLTKPSPVFHRRLGCPSGIDFDAARISACGEAECLCCISTKISGFVGAGLNSRNYSGETSRSHPRDLAGLSLRTHGKGNCRTPGCNSRQY
jgi:hypothetical protein